MLARGGGLCNLEEFSVRKERSRTFGSIVTFLERKRIKRSWCLIICLEILAFIEDQMARGQKVRYISEENFVNQRIIGSNLIIGLE